LTGACGSPTINANQMLELSQSVAPRKRSFLSWLGAICTLAGACLWFADGSFSHLGMLSLIAGGIFVVVDGRQKKELQSPHFLSR
jgi:hypothetical protein